MSIEIFPTQEQISNFNLVDYLGIGASIIILMVFSIFVIHWMFNKTHKNFQTAIIHVFAVPIVFALSSCTLDHYSQEPKLLLNSMHEWKGLGCTSVYAFLEVGVGGELF